LGATIAFFVTEQSGSFDLIRLYRCQPQFDLDLAGHAKAGGD